MKLDELNLVLIERAYLHQEAVIGELYFGILQELAQNKLKKRSEMVHQSFYSFMEVTQAKFQTLIGIKMKN
jgi:hypothetical protein